MSSPEQYHNSEPQPVTPERTSEEDKIHAGLDIASAFLNELLERNVPVVQSANGITMDYVVPGMPIGTGSYVGAIPRLQPPTGFEPSRGNLLDTVRYIGIAKPELDKASHDVEPSKDSSLIVMYNPDPSTYGFEVNLPKQGACVCVVRDSNGNLMINGLKPTAGIVDYEADDELDKSGKLVRPPLAEGFSELMNDIKKAQGSRLRNYLINNPEATRQQEMAVNEVRTLASLMLHHS